MGTLIRVNHFYQIPEGRPYLDIIYSSEEWSFIPWIDGGFWQDQESDYYKEVNAYESIITITPLFVFETDDI